MTDPDLYPFESRFLDVGETGAPCRMHYLDEGVGPPVVMVHGNPTWSFHFRKLVRALRGDHRVVVPDHVGCGLSDKPAKDAYPYSLRRRVDDLERLLAELDLDSGVTLVLHDWGGMIGMAWAARHPEAVERLVVLNTAAFHLPESASLPWQLRVVRDTPLGAVLVRGLNAFSRGAVLGCVTRRPLHRAVRAAYLAPYDSWDNRIAVYEFVRTIPLTPEDDGYDIVSDVEAALPALRDRPMLICWGERDFVFDLHFLAEWERRFPDADVHRFADAGHFVLEDAGDEIVPLVREFLTPHAAAV